MTLLLAVPAAGASPGGIALVGQPAPPEDPGGQGPDSAKAAPTALVILLLFFIAVALLVRSMNKHLRRIPESFDPPEAADQPGSADRPASVNQPDDPPRT
jgi:hypothetical protein